MSDIPIPSYANKVQNLLTITLSLLLFNLYIYHLSK